MIPFVDFTRQNKLLKKKLLRAVARVIDSQAYILGPDVDTFEREFASYSGVKYAVGVASGFDAILLSLQALGVGKGGESLTVPNTFISTALPILAVGARPVFVGGYNSRLDTIQAAILREKLPYLDSWVQKRRQIAHRYNSLLVGLPIVLPVEPKSLLSSFQRRLSG